MASLVIGITGKKRSGKDTFAARLISHHGFTQVRFADPLRAMALAVDPIIYTDLDGDYMRLSDIVLSESDWEPAKELPEVRRLLQRIGTEAGRDVLGEDIWVETARKRLDAIPGPVVITDVRFPNEADLIDDLDGVLVRIVRPGLESADAHPSETALDDYPVDISIPNDDTVAALHFLADLVAKHHGATV